MNILILGSGGREHALAWRLSIQDNVQNVYVLPGNPGMETTPKVECVEGDFKDTEALLKRIGNLEFEFVLIGPEGPLSSGLTDILEKEGYSVYGPSQEAAQLESSKIFSKLFMEKYSIPTAKFKFYNSYEEASSDIENWDFAKGVVLKADSLAAGKGVVVTHELEEAKSTLYDFMVNPDCSVKTKRMLIEEKLVGKELSSFALCDGNEFYFLGNACDYKKLQDDDKGPNTGGMGCYRPTNWPNQNVEQKIIENVCEKVLSGMKEEGIPFKGTLFVGLMIDNDEINVIEFNVRFGDPETQTLMPLLQGDFANALLKASKGKLSDLEDNSISLNKLSSVHIVKASGGYPAINKEPMMLNAKIKKSSNFITKLNSENLCFYAGVKNIDSELVNSGGRVLGVTSVGETTAVARELAYELINEISFEGNQNRSDIAKNI